MNLYLKPVFKQAIWGGNRLQSAFGYEIPGENTGECWAVSAHEHGDCLVASKEYEGLTLSALYEQHKELFGKVDAAHFPLLVKYIDARDDLSLQVHPDDAYASLHENGASGKTECWYVLEAEEDAHIVIGHHAKSKAELETMIREGRFQDLIRRIPVRAGDFFYIRPGTVHAICKGTLLIEIQQSSDLTYRLYDYDRLQNGAPRELHLEKSLDTIVAPFVDSGVQSHPEVFPNHISNLVKGDYFQVDVLKVQGKVVIPESNTFLIINVIQGSGTVNEEPVSKGMNLIVTAGTKEVVLEGQMELILSTTV